jgi:hypothetical protein
VVQEACVQNLVVQEFILKNTSGTGAFIQMLAEQVAVFLGESAPKQDPIVGPLNRNGRPISWLGQAQKKQGPKMCKKCMVQKSLRARQTQLAGESMTVHTSTDTAETYIFHYFAVS